MRKSRKLMMVLLAVLIIAMIPTTAFAKKAKKTGKGGKWYVPTAGTLYDWNKEKGIWEPAQESFEAKYDNKGRLKAVTFTGVHKDTNKVAWVDSYNFAWKGDFLKNERRTDAGYDDAGRVYGTTYETSYKYKAKKLSSTKSKAKILSSTKSTSVTTDVDGKVTRTTSENSQYNWGQKKGSYSGEHEDFTYENGAIRSHEIHRFSDVLTLKKGKIGSRWADNVSYKYYANGNLKSATSKSTITEWYDNPYVKYTEDVWQYNKAGFLQKYTHSEMTEAHKETRDVDTYDPEGDSWYYVPVTVDVPAKSSWSVTTYTWHMNGKKPESVEWGTVYSEGDPSNPQMWTFTNVKKVKQSRNCDAFGTQLWLGLWT